MSREFLLFRVSDLNNEGVVLVGFDDMRRPARILFSRFVDAPLAWVNPRMAEHADAACLTVRKF